MSFATGIVFRSPFNLLPRLSNVFRLNSFDLPLFLVTCGSLLSKNVFQEQARELDNFILAAIEHFQLLTAL